MVATSVHNRRLTLEEHVNCFKNEINFYEQLGNMDKAHEIKLRMQKAMSDISSGLERVDSMKAALKANPNDVDALHFLAMVTVSRGDFWEAANYFKRAVAIRANDEVLWRQYGVVLQSLLAMDEAVHAFNQALKIHQSAENFLHLAHAFSEKGDYESAIKIYGMGMKFYPQDSDLGVMLSNAYYVAGKLEEAAEICRHQIALHPDQTDFIKTLIYTDKLELDDPLVVHAEKLLHGKDTQFLNMINLAFAMFHLYQKHKLYDKAFECLDIGNRLRQSTFTYDRESFDMLFRQTKQHFKAAHEQGYVVADEIPDFKPIFIVGMPRSGTSLTEQVLSTVEGVFGAGELPYMHKMIAQDIAPSFPVPYPLYITSLDEMGKPMLNKMAQSYATEAKKRSAGLPIVVDKMPQNFLYLGVIKRIFPNAKIIHCTRNPMDNGLSIYSYSFGGRHDYAYDLENIGHYYQEYRALMDFWHEIYPDWIHDVHYETFVGNFEEEARKLLDFCELPWNDAVLEFHKTERSVMTASAGQVKKPLYNTSVEKWRLYEKQLAPLANALGKYGPLK